MKEKKVVKWLYANEAQQLGFTAKPSEEGRTQARYSVSVEQWDIILYSRSIPKPREMVETVRKLDKNGNLVSSTEKLQSEPIEVPEGFEVVKVSTSQSTGQQWVQYKPKEVEKEIKDFDFESIVKKHIKPIKITPVKRDTGIFTFDRAVITDVHTGMDVNKNGHSLYGGKWDEEEMMGRGEMVVKHILQNAKSNILFYDDLGDFMDGQDAMTVRKGHTLPQNMDNEKAYDVGVDFRMRQVDLLAPNYEKVIFHLVCNDNHSGSYGYYVNKHFKDIAELKYSNVEVVLQRKFIDHYIVGNKCFILTHGKDDKHLKFGFKPILDAKQIEKISNYIKEHRLWDYDIEFSKGDSHQKIFDESTSDDFYYYNYGAFSPSSEWVQTNFKKGKSFFEFFNFQETGEKKHHPLKFEWNTNREEITIDFSLAV